MYESKVESSVTLGYSETFLWVTAPLVVLEHTSLCVSLEMLPVLQADDGGGWACVLRLCMCAAVGCGFPIFLPPILTYVVKCFAVSFSCFELNPSSHACTFKMSVIYMQWHLAFSVLGIAFDASFHEDFWVPSLPSVPHPSLTSEFCTNYAFGAWLLLTVWKFSAAGIWNVLWLRFPPTSIRWSSLPVSFLVSFSMGVQGLRLMRDGISALVFPSLSLFLKENDSCTSVVLCR